MNPAVEALGASKTFGELTVVKSIDLTIGEGEFFSLLGPSGCGKTTLLRMIAGFEQPSAGKILVAGKDVSGVPPHKRPVNMVFQSYALFPHLSVFDNVAFGLRVTKACSEAEIKTRVSEALHMVRLPQMTDRFPRQLSGGQQQRVAFARAIVNKPAVLLLDEPLSALDPRIRDEMKEELARFKRELNTTFVMVTHDQSEAFALSDRIAVFNAGRIEQVGTPTEIYEDPSTPFVADFIGQSNLIQGRVVEINGDYARVAINQNVSLWGRKRADTAVDSPVTVFVRTDAFSNNGAVPGKSNAIDGVVLSRSYQGNASNYRIRLTDEVALLVSLPNSGGALESGSDAKLQLPADSVNLLPPSAN